MLLYVTLKVSFDLVLNYLLNIFVTGWSEGGTRSWWMLQMCSTGKETWSFTNERWYLHCI